MTMGRLHDFFDEYRCRNPEWAARTAELSAEFFEGVGDAITLNPVNPSDCTRPHPAPEGPNMDIGQCPDCWTPMGVMRPEGETYGWHSADCSLPLRHPGYCAPGGSGHRVPEGEKIRGYFGPDWTPDGETTLM